ncbi:hypothetical protein FB45DRAFT_943139, partial [Roridomyces roridus]
MKVLPSFEVAPYTNSSPGAPALMATPPLPNNITYRVGNTLVYVRPASAYESALDLAQEEFGAGLQRQRPPQPDSDRQQQKQRELEREQLQREQEQETLRRTQKRAQLLQMLSLPTQGIVVTLVSSIAFILLTILALELTGWFLFLGLLITILAYLLLIISRAERLSTINDRLMRSVMSLSLSRI